MTDVLFKPGDEVYFREKVEGDSFDRVTGLYIPLSFEDMVGNYYKISNFNGGKIYLEGYGYIFEPYWFDLVLGEIEDDSIRNVDFF